MQAEDDGSGSDSDFTILDDKDEVSPVGKAARDPVRERKPFGGIEYKPKIPKPAQYRHAIAREALTNEWEDDVDAMPDKASKKFHRLQHPPAVHREGDYFMLAFRVCS